MVRLTHRRTIWFVLLLIISISAGSWLFLTLRSQEKQPNGATIVQNTVGVKEVYRCQM